MNRKPIVLGVFLILLMTIISPVTSISKKTSNTLNLNGNGWEYDEETGTWSIEFPAEPLIESFTTKYYNQYTSKVAIIFSHEYYFPQYTYGDKTYFSKAYIEVSNDGGDTWELFDVYENSSEGNVRDLYIVLGQSFRVRFTVEGFGDSFISESGGFWRIWDIDLIGDTKGEPPKSSISIAGVGVGLWYESAITVKIRASDKVGVKEIHYILNQDEHLVEGDVAEFTISSNGVYYLTYWAIDKLGNEEVPKFPPLPLRKDNKQPTVKIKSPELGLYIFGIKIPIQINKTIIIGSFNIDSYAYDEHSGIFSLRFYLNDEFIGEIAEEPYNYHCNIKNIGNAQLKVIAEDWARNVAEYTLDIMYYNFL